MTNKNKFKVIDRDEINDNDIQFNNAIAVSEQGFDKEQPIIINEENEIIDGRHRYIVFEEEGRLNEVSYIQVSMDEWLELIDKEYENGTDYKFFEGGDYFWNKIKETFPEEMNNIKY